MFDIIVHVTSSRADSCEQRLPVTHLPLSAKLRLSLLVPLLQFSAGGVKEASSLGLCVYTPHRARCWSMTCR